MKKLFSFAAVLYVISGVNALAGGITFHTGNTNPNSDVRYLLQQAGGDRWVNSCIVNGQSSDEDMTCVASENVGGQSVVRLNYSYPTAWNVLRLNADRTGTLEYWGLDSSTGRATRTAVYKGIWKIK